MAEGSTDADQLRRNVARALERSLDPGDALPLLHRLVRATDPGTPEFLFAHLKLAELLAERAPWRASLHARRVLCYLPDDDRAWATLALCQTVLGHFRFARVAYMHALRGAPDNPWYAHNLGHLLDVALGRPVDALAHLERAYVRCGDNPDVVASYAHALGRLGEIDKATAVLSSLPATSRPREHAELLRWLERGAPAKRPILPRKPRPRREPRGAAELTAEASVRRELRAEFRRALAAGLAHLPFDKKQRVKARALARDVLAHPDPALFRLGSKTLAAAVAYAIVFVDGVPLSLAEVAAPFRISLAELRGAFATLQSELDVGRGGTRLGLEL